MVRRGLLFGTGRGGFVHCNLGGFEGVEGGECAPALSHRYVSVQRSLREMVAPD